MGITISKDTPVSVGEEYVFYDLAMFSCTLGEVMGKLKEYDGYETYGYNVYTGDGNHIKLFSYNNGLIYPSDFYHNVDNFGELSAILDPVNKYHLSYEKQWCVGDYCEVIGMPEKEETLIEIKKIFQEKTII